MSDTITDFAKVTQMLDAGWSVCIEKNELGSYSAEARHLRGFVMKRVRQKLIAGMESDRKSMREQGLELEDVVDSAHFNDACSAVVTDDFTPEQALTRLAYKVHGEII